MFSNLKNTHSIYKNNNSFIGPHTKFQIHYRLSSELYFLLYQASETFFNKRVHDSRAVLVIVVIKSSIQIRLYVQYKLKLRLAHF